MFENEKDLFLTELKKFVRNLSTKISENDEWTIRGFIDIFKNVYTVSGDTKVISKILELQLFPYLKNFADEINYRIELAKYQNWYPDMTFICKKNENIKFAVDLKTTYFDENDDFCNGFTLGSHGEYFIDRKSTKNIQYPYSDYSGHFCLGIIYRRTDILKTDEMRTYSVDEIKNIPSVIKGLVFFAEEKWKIASDKSGSGNTANIGSIQCIDDIINGNGVFAKAGEDKFDDYWANFGKIEIKKDDGTYKKMSSFKEYLEFKGLPENLNNPKKSKRSR